MLDLVVKNNYSFVMKLNKTEMRAMWRMQKHGFTWILDPIYPTIKAGKRAINKLLRLGFVEIKNEEPGSSAEYQLSNSGREFLELSTPIKL